MNIATIVETFTGLFDGQARAIEVAEESSSSMPQPGEPIENLESAFKALGFQRFGAGDGYNLVVFYLRERVDLRDLASEAFKVTRETMGRNGRNDASDAFRHAYLSFRLAQEFGVESAKQIGDGHERRPASHYESYTLNGASAAPGEMVMDLFNNHMGRQLFQRQPNASTLRTAEVAGVILRAINNRALQLEPFRISP